MSKWLIRIGITFATLIVMIVLSVSVILFTPAGVKLALWGAEKAVPEFRVGGSKGSLLSSFTLTDVNYQSKEQMALALNSVTLTIDAKCLLTPAVCVRNLELNGLNFSLPVLPEPTATSEEVASDPVTEITLPVPIRIDRVALNDIELAILGNQISWQHFSTAAEVQGNKLLLKPTVWQKIRVELAKQEDTSVASEQVKKVSDEPKTAIVLPEVVIPLDITVEHFDINDFELAGETPVVIEQLSFAATANQHDVAVQQLALVMPQVKLDLDTNVALKGNYPLTLDAKVLVRETDLKDHTLGLNVAGSVANMELAAQLQGTLQASIKGKLKALEPTLPFDLTLSDSRLQWPLTDKPDYQVKRLDVSTKGSLEGYQFTLASLVEGKPIPSLDLSLKGSGDLEHVRLSTLMLNALGGQVKGQAGVNWKAPLNWDAELNLANIQPGLQWPQAEGNISGDLATTGQLTQAGGWIVDVPTLDIDGVVRDYPLDLSGSIKANDKKGSGAVQLNIPELVLKHGPNGAVIAGQLNKLWDLDVQLNAPDLSLSVPDLQGEVQGQVHLAGELATPDITLDLAADSINWQQEATLESLSIKGQVTPLPVAQGDLTILAKKGSYQQHILHSLNLIFSGSEQQHQLDLNLKTQPVSTQMQLVGSLDRKEGWQGTLNNADIETELGVWQLNQPTVLGYSIPNQIASVAAHCWLQGESSVCVTDDIKAGESGEASLKISQFGFDKVQRFLPPETTLNGAVNATVWAKWAKEQQPEAKAHISVTPGYVKQKLDEELTLGWDDITLTADVKDNQVATTWLVNLTENGDIHGNATIAPIEAEGVQQTIDGQLKIEALTLAMLEPALSEYSSLDALINSDITLSGPVLQPKLEGQLTVEQLALHGDLSPVDINDGSITLDFVGYEADLDANIETPDGDLALKGQGNWADLAKWKAALSVKGDELKVNVPPMVALKVHPDLHISASPDLAQVTGSIKIPWGRIEVKELPQSAVGVSSDEVILNKELQPVEESKPSPMKVKTDIKIDIGDDVKLAAFGLEGGLIGSLGVTQNNKGPFIKGEINITDGTYRSFGQDLLIKKGLILFSGPADQPFVSINAIRNPDNTQDDVIAGVRVDGPADEPSIEIYSEPSLPQANALSYLLRGQNIDSESAGGGNMVTTTLIGLSLAKSGKVVGEIGEAFGVQDLALDTAGSGEDSQVTVSGYILPGLQVKYGVGIFNSLGEFTLRYRLMKDLYVEAVSGVDSAVDLLYQFEIE